MHTACQLLTRLAPLRHFLLALLDRGCDRRQRFEFAQFLLVDTPLGLLFLLSSRSEFLFL
jgi:hypothetical protein